MEEGRLVVAALHRGGKGRAANACRLESCAVQRAAQCSAIGRSKAPVTAWGSICLCLRSGLRHLYLLDPHLSLLLLLLLLLLLPPTHSLSVIALALLSLSCLYITSPICIYPLNHLRYLAGQFAATTRRPHQRHLTRSPHPHTHTTPTRTCLSAIATMRRSSSISSISSSSSESEDTMQIFVKTVSGSSSKSFPPRFRRSEQVAL